MALAVHRIIVKSGADNGEDVGEINSASLGYGLHQTWIFAVMFGAVSVFGVQPAGPNMPSTVLGVSLAVNMATLIVLGLFDQMLLSFITHRRNTVAAAALMCAGTLMVGVLSPAMTALNPLSVTAGVLTGVGSAVLLMFWGVAFARLDGTSIIMNTAIAFVVAAIAYAIVLVLPAPAGGIACAIIPWVEFALVWQHTPAPYTERRELPIFNRLPLKRGAFVLLFGLPMLLFGAALGFVRQVGIFHLLPALDGPLQIIVLTTSGLLSAIVLAFGLNLMHSDRIDDLVRPLLPIVALTLAFIPWTLSNPSVAWCIVVITGYFAFEAIMWVIMGCFAQNYRISPVLIFGIGRGFLGLGAYIGMNVNSIFKGTPAGAVYGEVGFTVIALACMVAGLALLPHLHDIKRAVAIAQIDRSGADDFIDRVNATADGADAVSGQGDGAGADADGGQAGMTGPGDPEAVVEGASSAEGEGGDSPDSQDAGKGGFYRRKCEAVANTYLLSNRESEVLYYLGRGFNAAYLEDKLFISEGTAKTHIRHIYGKTNVHSQQELMRLIDSTRV